MAPVIVVGRQGNTSRSLYASPPYGLKRNLRHWLDRQEFLPCRRASMPPSSSNEAILMSWHCASLGAAFTVALAYFF
jgi:hypothetical protein